MKKIFRVCIALLLCFSLVTPAFALDGIWHNPYGIDDLYDHEPTEIYPLTPIAGEMIYIKSTTCPIEPGQSVWLTYTKNGEPQQDVGAEWKYNDGNNSYWEAAIGPFAQGDVIEYTVYADKDGQNTQSIGPFSFHVVEWESAQSVELGSQEEGLVVLNVTPDQGDSTPKLGLSFPSADVLRFQFSPLGDVAFEAGAADYSIEEDSNIPAAAIPVTTQVFGTEPTGVTVNGQAIQRAATLDEFQAAQTAYYYSSSEKLVYIKTAAGDASEIEIEGIYQAPYEAEHAEQANVAVNTDHEGYYGEGFVDQFASEGCAVTFTVYSDSDTALLDVRYSAGTEAAQRTLLVNGESILLDLPKTQDWDSWNTVSVPVELLPGQNTITISYQAGELRWNQPRLYLTSESVTT